MGAFLGEDMKGRTPFFDIDIFNFISETTTSFDYNYIWTTYTFPFNLKTNVA